MDEKKRLYPTDPRGYQMAGYELRLWLGVPHKKLPGAYHKIIKKDGFEFHILTSEEARKWTGTEHPRSRPHRVYQACPGCTQLIPAGRMAQHTKGEITCKKEK